MARFPTLLHMEIPASSSTYMDFVNTTWAGVTVEDCAVIRIELIAGAVLDWQGANRETLNITKGGVVYLGNLAPYTITNSTHAAVAIYAGQLVLRHAGADIQGSSPGVNDIQLGTGASVVNVSLTTDLNLEGDFVQYGPASASREDT